VVRIWSDGAGLHLMRRWHSLVVTLAGNPPG
jgi:hypothetical protein